MRRLLGLLLILTIIFPFGLGLGGLLVASDVLGQLDSIVTQRVETINVRLAQTEETINAVSARFASLESVADQVSSAAQAAAQSVTANMADTTAHYGGVTWPAASTSPDIPAARLSVPALSSARGFLQNLYDTVASLASAIADVTSIDQVPGTFGQAVSEAQALAAELDALRVSASPTLLFLLVSFGVWFVVIYLLLTFRWLKQGWGMLRGRAG